MPLLLILALGYVIACLYACFSRKISVTKCVVLILGMIVVFVILYVLYVVVVLKVSDGFIRSISGGTVGLGDMWDWAMKEMKGLFDSFGGMLRQ